MNQIVTAPENGIKTRRAAIGDSPMVFTEVFEQDVNIAVWQRPLAEQLMQSAQAFLANKPRFQAALSLGVHEGEAAILAMLGESEANQPLASDIAELVDMFCTLFDHDRVGLRLTALNSAMCPKFHVDRVPCRMVTTYQGVATQWLSHNIVDRTKLGAGSLGLSDAESGIYQQPSDIQHMQCGDVALLKGEKWHGNENAGLVHRSPNVDEGQSRLLLTLDFG